MLNSTNRQALMEKNATEKERLATKALPYIPPFKSVFIDSSSTAFALSERMELSGKTVVTNSLQAAIQLSKKPNVTLVLLGGTVQFNITSSTGSWTARQLGDFNFDLMISSCSAVQGALRTSVRSIRGRLNEKRLSVLQNACC